MSSLSCTCRGTARRQYLTLLVLGSIPIFHLGRPGLLRRKRVVFRLRQVRIGLSKLTQELVSRFKGSAGIGALMAMITFFLRASMTTVTVNHAGVRIDKTPSQK